MMTRTISEVVGENADDLVLILMTGKSSGEWYSITHQFC
jgi:hypothetical protein